MTKLLGCLAIGCGAIWLLGREYREQRILLETLRQLQRNMEAISTAIRWQQMPLPEAVAACRQSRYTGAWFGEIAERVDREIPLHTSWEIVFSDADFPLHEEIAAIRLQGDREDILRQLTYAAQTLHREYETLRSAQREHRKLFGTVTLSGAAIMMILLW